MKAFKTRHPLLIAYLYILIGTGVLSVSIQYFFDPTGMVNGGISGLAIIIKSLTGHFLPGGIPIWLTNLVLNIPLFILGWILLGRRFVGRSLIGTVLVSAWLLILPAGDLASEDYLLAAVFGGVLSGTGVGLVLMGNATTGGTDLAAALLHKGLRHYSIGSIMQVLDGAIVIAGLAVFGLRPAMYAVISVFVAAKVTDMLLEGFKVSKAAYIISEHSDEIASRILKDLERGVTGIPVIGMYTGMDRRLLYCVVSRKQIVQVKDLVEQIDPAAFVIVSDVREVLGEGFQEYSSQ